MNEYCMFKGDLVNGAPFNPEYRGNPHYVIRVKGADGEVFTMVVNAASDQTGPQGDNEVYFYVDQAFDDPITDQLKGLELGLHVNDFPKLDYWQDRSLLDLHRMRPVPYQDQDGSRADVNDDISDALTIETGKPPEMLPFDSGHGPPQDRAFYAPTAPKVTVYGFGFLFPTGDGLHETHMNQGNPRGRHWNENGAFQDGALIIQRPSGFLALFTAFQTQRVPTDARGFPLSDSVPLPTFIRS